MAGVRDQDSSLHPLSMGNMQSWGEAGTKSVQFLDVVAASWHYESRQFIPFPNCHMLTNPGHSDLISCHRQVLVPAASAHIQQEQTRACFNLQGCKTQHEENRWVMAPFYT